LCKMSSRMNFLFFSFALCQFAVAVFGSSCTETLGGLNFDLTPLSQSSDYQLTIVTEGNQPTQGFINVCTPLKTATCGANAAGCQTWTGGYAMLGAATPFNLVGVQTDGTDGYGVMAAYANGNSGRTMEITFICDPNAGTGNPIFVAEVNTNYKFNWITAAGCPTNVNFGGGGSGGGGGGLSGGSILLIILLCVTVVYLVGGVLLNKFARHKEGMEMVPNVEFWISIPGLVKDGVLFIVHKIKGGGPSSYQQV